MAVIGVLGAGQLARMLALSGLPLGHRFVFLDPAPDPCAAPLGRHLRGDFADPSMLTRLAQCVDIVTCEFESVPASSIARLAEAVPVYPSGEAFAIASDRLREKQLFRELGIPVAPFAAVDSADALADAIARIGLPAVLKTRTLGYDGRGQVVLRSEDQLAGAWTRLGGVPLLLESLVAFRREISLLGVRGRSGETAFWPLVENLHRDGILRVSRCRPGDPAEALARDCATRVLERLDYVGVMALECFDAGDLLYANEMAPRVHNSGHWTLEGSVTSQFENHLRAVLGMPLGGTGARGHSAMVNLIGSTPDPARLLALPQAHLHLYDKAPRPGRKLGHVTVCAESSAVLEATLATLTALVDHGG